MSKLVDILTSRLVPTDALIFYKPTLEKAGGDLVEHRRIKKGTMCDGSPVSVRTLGKLLRLVSKESQGSQNYASLHGEIPAGLLYASSDIDAYRLVWYRKPEKRFLYFSAMTELPNGEMLVPGMVYKTDGIKLSVYCYKGRKPKDILYNAPFYNVGNGGVCLGNGKLPKPKENTFAAWMKYWEDMFWLTEFSHILGNNPIKDNLALITKDCILNGKPFPTEELTRTKTRLKDLLK